MSETEQWRPVPGYPQYAVSDEGRVKSLRSGKTLKCSVHPTGYVKVHFSVDGAERSFLVHRLILLAFKGEPPVPEWDGLHGDGCKTNNRLANLRWGSRQDNMADAIRHGTLQWRSGEQHPMRKLNREQVEAIRALCREEQKPATRTIALRFGIGETQVRRILRGERWI